MNGRAPTPRRLLIDTDPGIDDSMALLLAWRSPEVQVEAITTVFGNGGVETTTANALRLVELAQRSKIPVAAGSGRPLVREYIGEGSRVHGRNGLGEVDFPPPRTRPDQRRAANLICDTVLASPGAITLVALGPLTNLALAVSLEPRIAEQVHEVVLMGGAADGVGNASPVAEANIRNDPEAAYIVFHAGWPVTMVGLDVTRRTVMSRSYIDELCSAGDDFTDFIGAIVPHYMRFYRETLGLDGFQVHDSSALCYVLDPTLFETQRVYVDVERVSPHHFGQTVADWRAQRDLEPNVDVCTDVDSARVLALYADRLGGGDR